MTIADKIRNMNNEELADFIDWCVNDERDDWEGIGCSGCPDKGTHHAPECCKDCQWEHGIIGWLKSENDIK